MISFVMEYSSFQLFFRLSQKSRSTPIYCSQCNHYFKINSYLNTAWFSTYIYLNVSNSKNALGYDFVVVSEWTELRNDEFRRLCPTSYWSTAGMMMTTTPNEQSGIAHTTNYFNSIIISPTYEYIPLKYICIYIGTTYLRWMIPCKRLCV